MHSRPDSISVASIARWLFACASKTAAALITSSVIVTGSSAGNVYNTTTVIVNIAPACSLSVTPLAFGTLTLTSATQLSQSVTTATITATCTNNAPFTVISNLGIYNLSGVQKSMKHSSMAAYINYEIYTSSAHSAIYPTNTASAAQLTGTGVNTSITVYAKLPAQTITAAGGFSDTLMFTATF